MVTNSTQVATPPDAFTIDGDSIVFNGVELLNMKHPLTADIVAASLNYAHAVGTNAGVLKYANRVANLSSAQDAHLQATDGLPRKNRAGDEALARDLGVSVDDVLEAALDPLWVVPKQPLPGYSSGTVRTGNERRNEVRP